MGGEIVAIWLKRAKRGPMDPVMFAELVPGRGLRGSADQGGKRQITIFTEEAWNEAQKVVGVTVHPTRRRANVLVRGIDLANTRGRFLELGSCVIRIYGEVTPCEKLEQAQPGLRAALRPNWRGGVFGEIIEGGVIRMGDQARLRDDEPAR